MFVKVALNGMASIVKERISVQETESRTLPLIDVFVKMANTGMGMYVSYSTHFTHG